MSGKLIVAIDGPSGVGKSSVARRLGEVLGIPMLDTGAMYRAVALAVLEAGVDPHDPVAVAAVAERAELEVCDDGSGGVEARLGGRSVEPRIRTPEVSAAASVVAAHPAVRRLLVALQRRTAAELGAVVEGRDIGTVVFPDTPHKFFLDANPEVRAWRRREQVAAGLVGAAGGGPSVEQVRAELEERDRRDRGRDDSPLRYDDSYTVVDTSDLALDQVLEKMLAAIRAKS